MKRFRNAKSRIKECISAKASSVLCSDIHDSEGVRNRIAEHECISFDIFDTLIKRDVANPSDVFLLVAHRYRLLTGKMILNYVDARREAELAARKNTSKLEVDLAEIYTALGQMQLEIEFKDNSRRLTYLEIDDLAQIAALEIECEKHVCHGNPYMIELLDYSLSSGKTVVLISDMYLPKQVICELLDLSGVKQFDVLYLSSDIGLKKRSGLFEYAIRDLDIKPDKMLHIGDSWKSDYLAAKRCGIHALCHGKSRKLSASFAKSCFDDVVADSLVRGMGASRVSRDAGIYYRIGYEAFGILLFGYTRWLCDKISQNCIQDVFFLARDGYMMKRAYDKFSNGKLAESHYLYGSRRSYRVPLICTAFEYEDVLSILSYSTWITPARFLSDLGFDVEECKPLLDKNSLCASDLIKSADLSANSKIKGLYDDLKDDVITTSRKEYEACLAYLEQEHVCGRAAVVDIGWRGSLQFFIEKLLHSADRDADMLGLYLGLASDHHSLEYAYGYLLNDELHRVDRWNAFKPLIEALFFAREGSTHRFVFDDHGFAYPELAPYEYSSEFDADGDAANVKEGFLQLQKGALQFFEDAINTNLFQGISFTSDFAFSYLETIGMAPTLEQANALGRLKFINAVQLESLVSPRGFGYFVFHIKQLKRDLAMSYWKIGFLKHLIKLPLSYDKLYDFLKCVVKGKA